MNRREESCTYYGDEEGDGDDDGFVLGILHRTKKKKKVGEDAGSGSRSRRKKQQNRVSQGWLQSLLTSPWNGVNLFIMKTQILNTKFRIFVFLCYFRDIV